MDLEISLWFGRFVGETHLLRFTTKATEGTKSRERTTDGCLLVRSIWSTRLRVIRTEIDRVGRTVQDSRYGMSLRYVLSCQSLLVLVLGACSAFGQTNEVIRSGSVLRLDGRTVRIQKMERLPFVDSDYTRRFHFDSFSNPKLKQLRERYELERVVAAGADEFQRQVLLLDWVHQQFHKFGKPSRDAHGALEILQAVEAGHTFHCAAYAQLLVSAAASLGWIDRELALRRHQDPPGGGSTEHSTTEIWSNQYGKWVMLDPTANMHITRDGLPLNAYEIRQEWFYRGGTNLVFVIGKQRKAYRKADLPIFLRHFAGFGDLTVPADELDKYGFIGYIPNTDLMDAGPNYAQMFIVKDKLCDGTRWHRRLAPSDPAVDPYFPVNQAAIGLRPEGEGIRVLVRTITPNFQRLEARQNSAPWSLVEASFVWHLRPGLNTLEVRTVNQFGVTGPVSCIEVE